jgi:hypothetical protein
VISWSCHDRLREFICEHGITLDDADVSFGADGLSRGGRVSIRSGLEPAHELSVTVHQMAHELLHRGENCPASKTIREAEAEAFVVCQAISVCMTSSRSGPLAIEIAVSVVRLDLPRGATFAEL